MRKTILCALAILILALPLAAQVDRYTDASGETPIGPVASGPPGVGTDSLTFYTDRTMFETDFPGLTMEDWSGTSVGPGAIQACPPPFNSSTNNACFSPGAIVPGIELDVIVSGGGGELVVIGAGALGNPAPLVGPNSFTDDSVWNFSPEINAFGTVFNCPIAAAVMNIEVFDAGGASLGTTTATCGGPPGNFWGVGSTDPVARIEVTGGDGDAELYGETQFGEVVPTLGEWGMLALAVLLLAVGALALRRRSA